MKFYVSDTLCFVGENTIPKNSIYYQYRSNNTKIYINDTFTGNEYEVLITELKKSDGSAYTNKADLDAALPDFFSSGGAAAIQISSSNLVTNSIVQIDFSGGVYGDQSASKGITIDDIELTYTDNSDTLITCELLHITDTSNNELTGGEKSVYVHLYLEGQSDGNATVQINVKAESIFNSAGSPVISSESTDEFTLNSETIDFLTDLKGVANYLDFNDSSVVDADITATDKSGIGMEFSQSDSGLRPVNNIATTQSLDFSRGDYLEADQPIMLSKDGFSIFMAFYKNGGDQIVLSSGDFESLGTSSQINYIMFRGTTVLVAIQGTAGLSFTYTTPNAYNLIELRYDGSNGWTLLNNNVSVDTATLSLTSANQIRFDRIGSSSGSQGITGQYRSLSVYNGTDSTIRTAINDKLYAKFIGQTELSNTHRTRYQRPISMFALFGDSNAAGRQDTADLTAPYEYVKVTTSNSLMCFFGSVAPTQYNPDNLYSGELAAEDLGIESSLVYWSGQNNSYIGALKYSIGGSYLGNKGLTTDWIRSRLQTFPKMTFSFLHFEQYFNINRFDADCQHYIMMIGYNDTTDGTLTTAFESNFEQYKIDVRDVLRKPNLKFRTHNIQNGAGKTTINTALATLAAADSNHSNSTFTDGMVLFDTVHYDADSCVQIGKDDYDNWYSQ
jgi:hypothetical protein